MIMKLKYFITGLLLSTGFFSNTLKAQGNNNTLSLAPAYWVQGGGVSNLPSFPSNVNDTYHGEIPEATHASIQDENGDLLFFVVDGRIYDSEGYMIEEMWTGLTNTGLIDQGKAFGNSEVLIVPNPFDCKQYYLFSAAHYNIGSNFEPVFCILDLSLSNSYHSGRLGALVELQNNNFFMPFEDITPGYSDIVLSQTVNRGLIDMYYAAPKQQKCADNQLVFLSHLNGILIYEISPSGITFTNQLSYQFNNITGSLGTSAQRGEMEVVEIEGGNLRVAAPFQYNDQLNNSVGTAIYYADLTPEGQLIAGTEGHLLFPSPDATIRPYINGLEFSPNGNILYINHNITNEYNWGNKYYDFVNATNGPLNLMIGLGESFVKSQIETDLAGRLVMVKENGIAVLSDPDNPNVGNWDLNFLNFTNFTYQSTGTSALWNVALNGGEESYIISKQIKQRSYSDYLFQGGCATVYSDPITYSGTWSPGLGNNPFGSVSGVVNIDFTLVIPPGTNLNIQNMEFRFTPGNKFIVSRGNGSLPGANVTLRNTILTVDDCCDEEAMWAGVEVHGYQSANQFPSASSQQGKFLMMENSKIEHAYRGLSATRIINSTVYPFRPVSIDNSYNGGLVRALDSEFYNNQRDVEIHTYIAPNNQNNGALFRRCDFVTEGLINDLAVLPDVHILITGVEGVRFRGINVRNETPDDYAFNQRGIGLLGLNSRFRVDPDCLGLIAVCDETNPTLTPSTFSNLTFGVGAASFNPMRNFVVDRSRFINNYYGITAYNVNAERITRNHFEVLPTDAPNATVDSYGIFLGGCDGYIVEENFLTKFDDTNVSGIGTTYGIVVDNSGTGSNEIYKNDFTELLIGLQGQRINGYFTGNDDEELRRGLTFKCNNFFGDIYEADMAVTSGRIRRGQGTCFSSASNAESSPAGNKLSTSEFTAYNDFGVSFNPVVDQEIDYAHHFNFGSFITQPTLFTTQQINLNPCFNSNGTPRLYDPNKSCPSKLVQDGVIIGGFQGITPIREKLDSMRLVIDGIQNNLDGGDTEALLQVIATGSNEEVLAALLEASPYLSNEVLLAYFASIPPNGHLMQVVLANSPLSENVLEALNAMNVPNGVMNQINNQQNGISERDILIETLSHEITERDLFLNRSISIIMADTTIINPSDTVAELLRNEADRARRLQRCDALVCAGQEAEYHDAVDEFDQEYDNNVTEVSRRDNAVRHYEIDLSDTTNTDLIEFLQTMEADMNDEQAAARASTMLDIIFRQFQPGIVEKLILEVGGKSMIAEDETEFFSDKNYIKLYPNPTNGQEITLELTEELEGVTVKVHNTFGQVVTTKSLTYGNSTKIQTNGLSAGVYVVEITSNTGAVTYGNSTKIQTNLSALKFIM
jgi:hypothetical protein